MRRQGEPSEVAGVDPRIMCIGGGQGIAAVFENLAHR